MNKNPIGIFDSGVGGLSVFSQLIKLLPEENYLYFGDTINLPYGNKSKAELVNICRKIFDFFQKKSVKAVVMACNTTSALVYDELKNNYDFKIYPVVQTVAERIASENYKKIGVFATNATINSHAYKNNILKYNPNLSVFETACPTWVQIVENSLLEDEQSIEDVKSKLFEMMKNNADKIILGCTHYPYLSGILEKFADKDLFINPAIYFSDYISKDIKNLKSENNKKDYEPKFYVSSHSEQFIKASKLFYKVTKVEEISL